MDLYFTICMKSNDELYLEEGFYTKDDTVHIPKMKQFFREHELPYSKEFVSMEISNTSPKSTSLANSYGDVRVHLKDFIINNLAIVCLGDIQTTVVNEWNRKNPAKKFLNMKNIPVEKKKERLFEFIKKYSASTYIEGRMFRRLMTTDIEKIEDNSDDGIYTKLSSE